MVCEDNLRVVLKGGQTFSIQGALGACHGIEPDKDHMFPIVSRLRSNRSSTSEKITVDNIIGHHTGEIVKHRMYHGNVVFPIFPRDLEHCMLDNCPSVVVDDHIQCWNSMNENLPGLSVMSPIFSDGNANYVPWRMAPTWYCCSYRHTFTVFVMTNLIKTTVVLRTYLKCSG